MRVPAKWLTGIEWEGRRLVEWLGGRWTANGGMCRCPAHEDRVPSLSVRPGRSRLLLHCFAGCETSAVLRALQARGLLGRAPGAIDRPRPPGTHAARSLAAARLWAQSQSIAGTPAAAYLEERGLDAAPAELRYHPRTPRGPRPLTEFRPALIAAVRDGCGGFAVHRTFIEARGYGLASLAQPRCGLGRFGTGAVRLGGGGSRLGLAEGIETALSVTALFGVPCWATLGAERFGLVSVPADVRELLLFLDHDRGGRRAERLAREAFRNIAHIAVRYPERAGDDWNDVLRNRGRM
jgi:putative DNA primase/helicase